MKYLGCLLTEDVCSEKEVRTRIAMTKDAFNKHQKLLTGNTNHEVTIHGNFMHQPKPEKETNQDLSLDMKLPYMYVNFMVWSVLLYGSETWTLKKDNIKRLESCEMWIWRRMEKISWREHVRNEEVLRRVGEKRSQRTTIWKKKARWIGHVMRQKEC